MELHAGRLWRLRRSRHYSFDERRSRELERGVRPQAHGQRPDRRHDREPGRAARRQDPLSQAGRSQGPEGHQDPAGRNRSAPSGSRRRRRRAPAPAVAATDAHQADPRPSPARCGRGVSLQLLSDRHPYRHRGPALWNRHGQPGRTTGSGRQDDHRRHGPGHGGQAGRCGVPPLSRGTANLQAGGHRRRSADGAEHDSPRDQARLCGPRAQLGRHGRVPDHRVHAPPAHDGRHPSVVVGGRPPGENTDVRSGPAVHLGPALPGAARRDDRTDKQQGRVVDGRGRASGRSSPQGD